MEWLPRRALFALFLLHYAPTEAFHCSPIQTSSRTKNIQRIAALSMGLYEEDIDWDADLFGQIGRSNNEQSTGDEAKGNSADTDALDDSNWTMENTSNVKSMRKQMNQSWGKDKSKREEGKPTADWAGVTGPDEDEPWFTG